VLTAEASSHWQLLCKMSSSEFIGLGSDKGKSKAAAPPDSRPKETSLSSRLGASTASLGRSLADPRASAASISTGFPSLDGSKRPPAAGSSAALGQARHLQEATTTSHASLWDAGERTRDPSVGTDADWGAFRSDSESSATATAISGRQQASELPNTGRRYGGGSSSEPSRASATNFTPRDLSIRPEDGAAVLELLESDAVPFHDGFNGKGEDDWPSVERDILARQRDPFRNRFEGPPNPETTEIPLHPRSATVDDSEERSDELVLSPTSNPFLFSLLDGASVVEYLGRATYTDDIWGLPEEIRRTVEDAKGNGGDEESRDKALRRLAMLKRQFDSRRDGDEVRIARSELDEIWDRTRA
jgi:hypothetical protein